ncbi:hypothetical protein Poli38472_008025 [Pythium oligandrum]|uniref:Uncharacterized protein n=1 Tax=Pythium oligandrum TaxID=41045 RepID=A0A8K1FP88_PYTOL|nr:hypothetical protein Poli38472_008025 [Pythium oligandrum]|eukprot:TMW65383.1 hypothetical protein Poli38472_008025 [Pythium oligandrum]
MPRQAKLAPSAAPRKRERGVLLSPLKFSIAWFGLLALHALCFGYFLSVSRVYRGLSGTYLAVILDFYSLGMPSTHYPQLSKIHLAIACLHAILAGVMIISSIVRRRLAFYPFQRRAAKRQTHDRTLSGALMTQTYGLYAFFYGRHGIFGVESPYFDLVLVARECLDMTMQSYQAYRLSRYVPRLWLNRVYVALLVISCWSMPLIHIVYKRQIMLSRLLLLFGNALLDLFSTIGLAVILLTSYYKDYDSVVGGFPREYWYNDEWVVNFFNEFQFVLVVSWMDLLSRVLFYSGLVVAVENMKELLRQAPTKKKSSVGPSASFVTKTFTKANAVAQPEIAPTVQPSSISQQPSHRRFDRVAHCVFVVWGLVVLGLHLHAKAQLVPQCLMQVRPWTATQPTCVLLAMDCHINDVRGHEDDINPYWELVDPITVTRIVIRHCPELHMPPTIQRFNHLDTLKLYNTTVVDWSDSAALTKQHHPVIGSLFAIRTNFTGGQLPPGLASRYFPQTVYDIEFSVTNLHTLPDDLDTKWPRGATLYIELSEFERFPSVLTRVQPLYLSLAANRLTEFPVETLQTEGLNFLTLAANPLTTLDVKSPSDVKDVGTVSRIMLMETNVSSLPQWLESFTKRGRVNLHNAPLCTYLQELEAGTRTHFPAVETTPPEELASVMLTSDLTAISKAISCKYYTILLYPLMYEDQWSALTPQPVLFPPPT